MKTSGATVLDLSTLPEHARKEVTDFYRFIMRKHRVKSVLSSNKSAFEQLFQRYQLDMSNFNFDRDAAHER